MSPPDSAAEVRQIMTLAPEMTARDLWPAPDMGVLRLHRRQPPALPIAVFGKSWGSWVTTAAEAAACPPDYVAAPLLASVSALIGHARWVQATPGWAEPPHLWVGAVGDSGAGKSPGADCLMRDVLPEIERRMLADYPDRLREWRAAAEIERAAVSAWQELGAEGAGSGRHAAIAAGDERGSRAAGAATKAARCNDRAGRHAARDGGAERSASHTR